LYRKELGSEAMRIATEQGLGQEATNTLVAASKAKMPKLTTRTRRVREQKNDFANFLDGLLAEADGENETESPE